MIQGEGVEPEETFESPEELSDEYRDLITYVMEFTGRSELMAAFAERPWIEKAPNYHHKLSLIARIQDEVGHAQMQFRHAEQLGCDREEMRERTTRGDVAYGIVTHYPVKEWLDIAMMGWLIDGAAMQLQQSLMKTSYGPYARTMRRICREEEFHIRQGERMVAEYTTGSRSMQQAADRALARWWPRALMFFGPPGESNQWTERMIDLGIRTKTNDELRQDFLDMFVPKIRKHNLEIPDDDLQYNEALEEWQYTEPDWDEFDRICEGDGPLTQERIESRRDQLDRTQWVRDIPSKETGQTAKRVTTSSA